VSEPLNRYIAKNMETILVLAHTENDGSLAKSAREALHAAATLHKSLAGSKLLVGIIGENIQAAANSIAACPATKYFGVTGADFCQSPALQWRRMEKFPSIAGITASAWKAC
jgi:electron transfer flavoprotein alpha subunit